MAPVSFLWVLVVGLEPQGFARNKRALPLLFLNNNHLNGCEVASRGDSKFHFLTLVVLNAFS